MKVCKALVTSADQMPAPRDLTTYWSAGESAISGIQLDKEVHQLGAGTIARLAPLVIRDVA